MSSKTKSEEEPERLTLPVGHPLAGYVEPDLSYHEGTGVLPAEELDVHDARNTARAEEAEKVAVHEDKVARAIHDERLSEGVPKTASKSSSTSSSS